MSKATTAKVRTQPTLAAVGEAKWFATRDRTLYIAGPDVGADGPRWCLRFYNGEFRRHLLSADTPVTPLDEPPLVKLTPADGWEPDDAA